MRGGGDGRLEGRDRSALITPSVRRRRPRSPKRRLHLNISSKIPRRGRRQGAQALWTLLLLHLACAVDAFYGFGFLLMLMPRQHFNARLEVRRAPKILCKVVRPLHGLGENHEHFHAMQDGSTYPKKVPRQL